MKNFFNYLLIFVIGCLISLIVGMISPGKWLTAQQQRVTKLYNSTFHYRGKPIAEEFITNPFDLHLIYLENTEGRVETYLVNGPRNEMLPVLEVEGTTQVGDITHRVKGLGEEGRGKLKNILENVKDGSTGAIDKALQFLGD